MDTTELLRFHHPPRTGKRRGLWIVAGLLALGIVALAACGKSADTPTLITEACCEAITAGDTEAALDLFIDDALVTVDQTIYDGKDSIREWIDSDIAFLRRASERSEWSNVTEVGDSLDFYERCTMGGECWQGHHTLYFQDGKIRSWTMTFVPTD
jgi:ketosteroid isomerase-like protein